MKRVDRIMSLLKQADSETNTSSSTLKYVSTNKKSYFELTPVILHDHQQGNPYSIFHNNESVPGRCLSDNTFDATDLRGTVMEVDTDVQDLDVREEENGSRNSSSRNEEPGPSNIIAYDSDDSIRDKNYVPSEDESGDSDRIQYFNKRTIGNMNTITNSRKLEPSNQLEKYRWNVARPSIWGRNVEKEKRSQGEPYKSVTGRIQAPKIPNDIDCSKCRYKCKSQFSQEERQLLCKTYWNLTFERQRDFIIRNVVSCEVKSRRPRKAEDSKQRTNARSYFFGKNENKFQLCQKFFCKTLCISNLPIINAFKNRNETGGYCGKDKRGQKIPGNKTSQEVILRVKEHIESFPVMESHYTRKSTKRLYLDSTLNITKMHNLFLENCRESNNPGVSLITYRRIFCQQYNMSLFKPKKDQCLTCNEYEKASANEKDALEVGYRMHLERKEASMHEKNEDKTKATNDKSFKSVSCDMQSVLQIPTSQVSLLYYLRKLNLYDFTVYESAPPNKAFCYFWTEVNGKRGSCEIGTCLAMYINSLSHDVTHLSIFSDTCGGQNRNVQVTALLLHLVRNHHSLQVIEQKFMESGHSYVEVDSMHSAIERAKQNLEIFSVHEYENIFKMARLGKKRNKSAYQTRELQYNEFLDLKKLVQMTVNNRKVDSKGNIVNWLKVKCFKYEKSLPNTIQYKYGLKDEYEKIDIGFVRRATNRKGKENKSENAIVISKLYAKQLPISAAKKKDLLKLCEKNIIPQSLHSWYKNLPSSSSVRDNTVEPAGIDSSDEQQE